MLCITKKIINHAVFYLQQFAKMVVRCVQYIIILWRLCSHTKAVEEKCHINNYSDSV